MDFEESIRSAFISLRSNLVRSILTMLGIIIGVFAVVSLVSVGIGIRNYVTSQFEGLGSNLIIVAPGVVDFADDPAKAFSRNKLADEHIELVETYAGEYVQAVTPSVRLSDQVTYKTKAYDATIVGANYKSSEIINFRIAEGRLFSRSEERSNSNVVLIGKEIQNTLFGTENPLGKDIKLGDYTYTVIGLLEEQGNSFDDRAIAPYTTIMDDFSISNFSNLAIKAKTAADTDLAISFIEVALLRDLAEDDFTVLSQTDLLSSIQNILGMLTVGIGAIAGISLLVGGIGIMNIMLVSVTERTREIGLRKAVGATPKNILIQFLFEAVILSVIGGSIGIILGWIAAKIGSQFIETAVPFSTILLAFGFSASVGILFGTYPALNASKKDPIAALTFE